MTFWPALGDENDRAFVSRRQYCRRATFHLTMSRVVHFFFFPRMFVILVFSILYAFVSFKKCLKLKSALCRGFFFVGWLCAFILFSFFFLVLRVLLYNTGWTFFFQDSRRCIVCSRCVGKRDCFTTYHLNYAVVFSCSFMLTKCNKNAFERIKKMNKSCLKKNSPVLRCLIFL